MLQYSSGNSKQVELLSASVMTQIFTPLFVSINRKQPFAISKAVFIRQPIMLVAFAPVALQVTGDEFHRALTSFG